MYDMKTLLVLTFVDFWRKGSGHRARISSMLSCPRPCKQVSQIGYMASPYSPNLDALKWFIDEIWDRILEKYDLTLNIYGNIKNTFEDSLLSKSKNIVFHGLPLITTTHGASGMEDGASTAFFVANDPGEYMRAFDAIVGDYTFRRQLAESAFKYANMHFSQESCYKDLLWIIT